ncbi:hypothetical protein OIU76_007019 [Salix suchowensis]|nr:hypothetical protein OIU76_007019 [Salix suchowensis]
MNVMNYERTSLINNSHELECNLELASASPDSNTRNDFTSDQFIESLIQIEADCRVEKGIKNTFTNPLSIGAQVAGIIEVLLSKADENLFSDTRQVSCKRGDTPALAFVGWQTTIQTCL